MRGALAVFVLCLSSLWASPGRALPRVQLPAVLATPASISLQAPAGELLWTRAWLGLRVVRMGGILGRPPAPGGIASMRAWSRRSGCLYRWHPRADGWGARGRARGHVRGRRRHVSVHRLLARAWARPTASARAGRESARGARRLAALWARPRPLHGAVRGLHVLTFGAGAGLPTACANHLG